MGSVRHYDLCIIGSGSGNSIVDKRFVDRKVALIDAGTFGGTCLNVGCIPSKMYVYPSSLAQAPALAHPLGVDLDLTAVHWTAMRDRIFGRIDAISDSGKAYREKSENVTLFTEPSRFVGERTMRIGAGPTITADRFVLAAGSRPVIPDLPGLSEVTFHTSDTVMRLPRLPKSMIIMGGGYVAAEFAHIFSAFGTAVTVVVRSDLMLRHEDADVAARFTELVGRQVDLRLRTTIERVESVGTGEGECVRAFLARESGPAEAVTAEVLLVGTGRVPNGDTLDLAAAGVEMDDDGYVVVDDHQRTTAEGVFALGDVCSHRQLKHVANHEARVVQHNLLNPDSMITSDHRFVPHAVFSDPQVASCGLTEAEAGDRGIDYRIGYQDYSDVAYGWAMEDQDHFVKIIIDASTDLIVGAHLIGPHASSLIQPLIQAMSFGQRAGDVARGQYWIHPALAEVVENALLDGAA
jgi:mycothione reductase